MAPIPNPPAAPPHEHHASSHSHATAGKREHAAEPSPHPAAAAPRPEINPILAAQLRARGLEELNRGAVGKAVDLLSRASQLDPSNALIRRDLDRAERIARAVHASH